VIIGLECGLARAEQASLACYLNARPTVCWLMSRRPLLEERFAMLGFGLPLLFLFSCSTPASSCYNLMLLTRNSLSLQQPQAVARVCVLLHS